MPRVIETNLTEEDKKIEKTLRPQCLDDYIGQEKAKSTLKIYIEAAKQRHDSLDHVLFYGHSRSWKDDACGDYRQRNGRQHEGNQRSGDRKARRNGCNSEQSAGG